MDEGLGKEFKFMQLTFGNMYDLKPQFTEEEKNQLLMELSNKFTEAHKLMAWIEDPAISLETRVQFFNHMYCIFNSMHILLHLLKKSGLTEKEIIAALNDVPF